jgi:Glycosyl hydrolase family 57/Domain of unknown function (DUF3536)
MPAFCVHCHFYQRDRGDPFAADGTARAEPGAEPHHNFTEKIAATCYTPNAQLGNFDLMSFDVGPALLAWMQESAPETYAAVVAAGGAESAGNALALPQHHTILPLGRRRHKITQVAWGLATFAHHYGRPAEGMWLPEMAVDLETLETLAAQGVQFTILSGAQVEGADDGAGPYWVNLGGGKRLAVYVREDTLSNQVAFELPSLGGAGRWARGTLGARRKTGGRLTLVATDGETFGYHHRGEEHFLHWLLAYEAHAIGYDMTTLARDFRDHPPRSAVEVHEFTAWSCPHGHLRRWSTGCECTPGDSRWKSSLRRAFDNLSTTVDEVYLAEANALGVAAWPLRDAYIRVLLGEMTGPQLLAEHGLERPTSEQAERLLQLLAAGFFAQRTYASGAFFRDDLARPGPRFSIASGAKALLLVQQAVGQDFIPVLRRDLGLAAAADGRTGAQLLDELLAENPS